MAERFQELLYLIALAALVLRAQVFDYGQLQLMGEIRYALLALSLYTSDAADDLPCVDHGSHRTI